MRLPGLLLSVAAIYFTYRIGAHLCGPRAGLLAAFFHATNGYMLQLPGGRVPVDHVDNDLLFFVELGIFLSVLYLESGRRSRVFDQSEFRKAISWFCCVRLRLM